MEIIAHNVNQAFAEGMQWLRVAGVKEPSRNGPVIVSPEPVMTTYVHPCERVLFSPLRNANPFFHLMEALWMLAGHDDVAWPAYFAANIKNYSDDGVTLHGAYGHRWRYSFGFDQLKVIAEELKGNPASRRCVLQMWDGGENGCKDLRKATEGCKDVPCNSHAYFDCRGGVLNMTVLCRSNDMIWGGYGANAVHFSVLQEYLAIWIGVPVGLYRQFSNNFHVYEAHLENYSLSTLAADAKDADLYRHGALRPFPLISINVAAWDCDLQRFFERPAEDNKYRDVFFSYVARPMYLAWKQRKDKRGTGLEYAQRILAADWREACCGWIERKEKQKEALK
jgi:hypothetical protein